MSIVSLQSGMHLPFGLVRHMNASHQVVVGSSAAGMDGADLRLVNVLPRHAIIFQKRDDLNKGDRTWWIKPASPDAELFIDKVRVCDDAVLLPGHVLSFVEPNSEAYESSIKLTITVDGKLMEAPDKKSGVSIRCEGLSASGKDESGNVKPLLSNVSFKIEKGEFVGIIGPSGCGKSSLMERLAGIGDYTGEIWVNGRNLREAGDELARQRVFVVQDAGEALHKDMTIREELDVAHRIHTAASDADSAMDEAALKKFHLDGEEFTSKVIGKFSGGERRRAALARALSLTPKLLLLDEPTAGLDPDRERDVMHWLKDMTGGVQTGRSGCTVLCVTHVFANIDLFDRVLIFASEGKLVFSGAPQDALVRFKKTYPEGNGKYPGPIKSLADVFPILSSGDPIRKGITDEGEEIPEPPEDDFPEVRARPSSFRCFGGYFRSIWRSFKNLPIMKHLLGLFIFPALLALVIRFVCNEYVKMLDFYNPDIKYYNTRDIVLPFCSCLAVFWLGLVSSVRDLVDDRYPRRCLEHGESVSLLPYLASRYLWRFAMVGCQSFVFSLAIVLAVRIPWQGNGGVWIHPVTVFPLLLSAWSGVLLGLAVSAMSRSTTSALGKVPYIAIAQLLFSKVVLDRGNYPAVIEFIRGIMPCDKTIEGLESLWYPQQGTANAAMWGQFLIYAIVLAAFGAVMQRKREKEWKGR